MQSGGFQKLKVWQKAHNLVLKIYELTKALPEEEKFCLSNQIRRSSVSICANIAEGQKKTKKDFLRFLDISQGSLEETKYHLILCRDLGYCKISDFEKISAISDEVGKMLFGLSKKLKTLN